MAQSLNQNREEGQSTLSAEAVLEQLLRGELSLVSQTARGHIIIAADEINYQQNQALPGQEAPSNATAADAQQQLSAPETAAAPEPPAVTQPHPQADGPMQQVTALENQIGMLPTRLNQRRDQQAAQQAKIDALVRKTHQQAQESTSARN